MDAHPLTPLPRVGDGPAHTRGDLADAAPHHVVILGGGFGGVWAARALGGKPVRVTVIDKRNVHVFQPLLYQVATAALSPAEIAFPIRSMFTRQPNVRVLMADATGVDLDRRVVTLDSGDVAFDSLIIAVGVRPGYFGRDDWEAVAPGLKTLSDAERIRDRVLRAFERAEREPDPVKRRELLTFVIIGGGPTGVEMAGAIGELAHQTLRREYRAIDPAEARIILVNGGQHLLDGYPKRLVKAAATSLARLGVEVMHGTRVTALAPGIVTLGEQTIASETVIWAAGVEAPPITKTLGVPLAAGGRVPVNADLTMIGHPEVMAIGDVAALVGSDGQWLPGVAQVAMQAGVAAAKNILRQLDGGPTQLFHYRDKGMIATIGRNRAIADIGPFHLSGFPAWAIWALIHIASLIGFRSRLTVMLQWMWSYVTQGRGARIIRETDRSSSGRMEPSLWSDQIIAGDFVADHSLAGPSEMFVAGSSSGLGIDHAATMMARNATIPITPSAERTSPVLHSRNGR